MAERCIHQTKGLYNPQYEHDSCGVGFIVRLDGEKSHKIVRDGIVALENLKHRGACGCEVNTGDCAGVLIQVPDHFLRAVCAEQHIFMPVQLKDYSPDLSDPRMKSALCMFHSRFSTNTFPSWRLAHPYRMISHNGEINTLRGNINWMRAREALFESPLFDDGVQGEGLPSGIQRILPIIDERGSDTACFDNALEMLTMTGRPVEQAMMMMIPEPWDGHESMPQEKKDFYDYHSCLMEPWDGPASIAFTDGRTIGAVLDRNGLRPSRYYVTKDGYVIMASEVGVLPIPPENILHKGRLQPGRMFLISLDEGRIIDDAELKHKYAGEKPYGEWLKTHMRAFEEYHGGEPAGTLHGEALTEQQLAFG